MEKHPLTEEDMALVETAVEVAGQSIKQIEGERKPALVSSALRMDDGTVFTSHNLIADVGSISICAEPQAIAQANRHPDKTAIAIVAVYHQPGHAPRVIPPCGRCREVITDFLSGFVILRDPGTTALYKVKAGDLLPLKYADYWDGNRLI